MDRGNRTSHSSLPPGPAPEDLEFDDPTLVRALPSGQRASAGSSRIERLRVLKALEACDGDHARAAQLLGVSRESLIELLDESNLPRPRKR